jgi:hypothetical protein
MTSQGLHSPLARVALLLMLLGVTAALDVQDIGRFKTSRTGKELPLPSAEPSFQFAVFGDRTGGPDDGVKILAEAVEETNLIGPDLVLTVGDLINGYNTTPEWMLQMVEFRTIMGKLKCPWFPVAGNHDVYWRGPGRPAEEHEGHYEEHFGPLWYAFEHKGSWFIILYSDEPDPQTGERNFSKPNSQKMSPVQFEWLRRTLKETVDAENIFVFLHHPRWNRGNYGDDWGRVHELLADAGNVRAVFAGHVHRMQYAGPRDGIEYFTLATTGGHQSGSAPEGGWLHHYELITVRGKEIDVVSFPVGSADDPRAITHEVSRETAWLSKHLKPAIQSALVADEEGGVYGTVTLKIRNPVQQPVEFALTPLSDDLFWSFTPDHWHGVIEAGAETELELQLERQAAGLNANFRFPSIEVAAEYLTATRRLSVPTQAFEIPISLSQWSTPPRPQREHVLILDGNSAAAVDSAQVTLEQGAFTLEAWVNGNTFGGRRGLINKTEVSEYGIFASNGIPEFIVFLDGAYVSASAADALLNPGEWHHVAGVFDGGELRLYIDGSLKARTTGAGTRKLNTLPLMIGADVNADGDPTSQHSGSLDEVRLSHGARYSGESFTPERRHVTDEDTRLLLHADAALGPWLHDSSARGAHPRLIRTARVSPAAPR